MMRRLFLLCLLILLGFGRTASASVERDVDTWLQLRDTSSCYQFALYRQIIENHPDWPDLGILRTMAEQALNDAPPDASVILAWFKARPPISDNGKFLYFKTLVAAGETEQARQFLNEVWAKGAFNGNQQDALTASYGRWITPQANAARVDALLWAGNLDRAQKALDYVGGNTLVVAKARLGLQRSDGRVMSLISSLPVAAQQEPGLIFDLTRYYRQKGQDERAALTLSHHRDSVTQYNASWWKERALLARRALERGDFQSAYALAAAHGHQSGAELADAEWLAGWLAVSRLNRPDLALKHFDRMYRNVKAPISVARAAYWAGVASDKSGQKQTAQQWYALAAEHMQTFYGQMAAYALGDPNKYYVAFFGRNAAAAQTNELHGPMAQAATYLYKKGREKERDLFLSAILAQFKTEPQKVIPLARQLHSPKIRLAAAKAAYENGTLIADELFPRLNVPANGDVEPALTLGIIRQESMFDPYAQSSARAMGLMQLLPTTAAHVAKRNGLAHKNAAQLFDPHHNMILGQAYLGSMLSRYGGEVPLAAAAYNAGPGNVDNWIAQMGDPQADEYSWVDWVERIPFYETRNYVQRVWESYQIYQYMIARDRKTR